MVAAAFKQTLILRGSKTRRVVHIQASVDDVASNYVTFPDGNSFLQIPSDDNYQLIDVIVVTGGTDTNNQELFVNGLSTGLIINNKSNLNTAVARQFQQAPITLRAGSLIRLKESA